MQLWIFTVLLVCLLFSVAHASPKHPSPIELYGVGGTDILSKTLLSKDEIVSCFYSLCDITHDQMLDRIELDRCLKDDPSKSRRAYLTTMEATLSNLNSDSLMRQCDADHDKMLSYGEVHDTSCLHMAQIEALAAKVCSRAQHADYTYSEWRQRYVAIKNVKSMSDVQLMAFRLIDREVNPHRGDIDMRVGTISGNQEQIGGKLTPELIFGILYVIFAVIFMVLVSALVFEQAVQIIAGA